MMPLLDELGLADPCACGKKEASECASSGCGTGALGGADAVGCGPSCSCVPNTAAQSSSCCSSSMPSGGCGSGCSCSSGTAKMPNIKMITDDGEEVECLTLDTFEFEGKKYIAILPESQDGETTSEIILLTYVVNGRTTSLNSIENEQEHARVQEFFNSYFEFDDLQLV